jgi:hypothetical protein
MRQCTERDATRPARRPVDKWGCWRHAETCLGCDARELISGGRAAQSESMQRCSGGPGSLARTERIGGQAAARGRWRPRMHAGEARCSCRSGMQHAACRGKRLLQPTASRSGEEAKRAASRSAARLRDSGPLGNADVTPTRAAGRSRAAHARRQALRRRCAAHGDRWVHRAQAQFTPLCLACLACSACTSTHAARAAPPSAPCGRWPAGGSSLRDLHFVVQPTPDSATTLSPRASASPPSPVDGGRPVPKSASPPARNPLSLPQLPLCVPQQGPQRSASTHSTRVLRQLHLPLVCNSLRASAAGPLPGSPHRQPPTANRQPTPPLCVHRLQFARNGSFSQPPSPHQRPRAPPDQGPRRPQPDHPQPHLVPPLANHPAASLDAERTAGRKEPQDADPRLHGVRRGQGAVAMGQGARTEPWQDWPHEGRRRHLLAARDLGEQPEARAGQRDCEVAPRGDAGTFASAQPPAMGVTD